MTTLMGLMEDRGLVAKEDMGADMLLYQEVMTHGDQAQELGNIHVNVDDLDNLMRGYNDVAQIGYVVQNTVDNGLGIPKSTAQLAEIAIESIYSNLNLKISNDFLPALESFSDSKLRLSSTRIALESVMDRVKQIAKALVEAIVRIWKTVKEFLSKVFSRKTAIVAGLNNVLKQVDQIPNDAQVTESKLPSIATEDHGDVSPSMRRIPFGINGKCGFETTKTITDDTSVLIQGNKEIAAHIVKCLKAIAANVEAKSMESEVENLVKQIKDRVARLDLKNKKIDGPREVYTYGYLIAGQVCVIEEFIAKSHLGEDVKLFNIQVNIKQDKILPYEPDLLKKPEMAALGKMAIELVNTSKDLEHIIPALNDVLDSNIEYLKSKFNPSSYEHSEDVMEGMELVKDLFKYVTSNLPKLNMDANKVAVDIGHYIKDCVAIYMKHH